MKTFDIFSVRPATEADWEWICERLDAQWGGTVMVVHSEAIALTLLPAIVAGKGRGFVVYRYRGLSAEIVAMDVTEPCLGIGTALLHGLGEMLRPLGVQDLWVTTTNDNLDALRFYQRRGFRVEFVHRDAVARARLLKPQIPTVGYYGIPVCDEIDLRAALPLPAK